MEIRELRIGNLIDRNGLMEVKGINLTTVRVYDHYNKCSISHGFPVYSFKGIELTPEWLERLGFYKCDGRSGELYSIKFNDKNIIGYWLIDGATNVGEFIPQDKKYVHQLQNLFYSLTGEELAIDKTSLKS